jgi:hypothetical protein
MTVKKLDYRRLARPSGAGRECALWMRRCLEIIADITGQSVERLSVG